MFSRREVLRGGLGALAMGLLPRRSAWAQDGVACPNTGARIVDATRPFLNVANSPSSVMVGGLPFAPWFTGDDFPNDHAQIPFHHCENCFPDGHPPTPEEDVDVVVVGGGISGLATAWLLRDHEPVVLEMRPRFGGNAMGEVWNSIPYSLGSAYVITPDEGSFLDQFYRSLGLHRIVRVDEGAQEIELFGRLESDFWTCGGCSPEDVLAFRRYADTVRYYADRSYPEIPLPVGRDNQWIIDLDQLTLRQDIEQRVGIPLPMRLVQAIQAYCYSSFGIGWDEISAAGGWNFIAAEEFGRWVFPGGNVSMVDALWRGLRRLEAQPGNCPGQFLRGGCMVVDVRLVLGDRVQVTYRDSNGALRSLTAKRVVMACSKHICKWIMRGDLERLDPDKFQAMQRVDTMAYLVANVLLHEHVKMNFYDIFLLGNGDFPVDPNDVEAAARIVDVLNGRFAHHGQGNRSVFTLYWPLPWHTARFSLYVETAWMDYAQILVGQIGRILELFGLTTAAVRQVRLTRWSHAMPVNTPGLMADGTIAHLRRTFEGKVFFINQDNWALPAVENCLLEAEFFVPQIVEGL